MAKKKIIREVSLSVTRFDGRLMYSFEGIFTNGRKLNSFVKSVFKHFNDKESYSRYGGKLLRCSSRYHNKLSIKTIN